VAAGGALIVGALDVEAEALLGAGGTFSTGGAVAAAGGAEVTGAGLACDRIAAVVLALTPTSSSLAAAARRSALARLALCRGAAVASSVWVRVVRVVVRLAEGGAVV
jgi:hypothetical protein